MDRKLIAVVGTVLVVAAIAALAMGANLPFPPATDQPGDGIGTTRTIAATTTPTTSDGGTATASAPSDGTATTTTTPPPFAFSVESVDPCGTTCRDVTVSLHNQQSTTATGVSVHTQIFAGKATDGKRIWSGEESIGTLQPGATVTRTKRVELGYFDAIAVQQQDGWITIRTNVHSDTHSVTFTEERQVL